jgi:hypothetical protein
MAKKRKGLHKWWDEKVKHGLWNRYLRPMLEPSLRKAVNDKLLEAKEKAPKEIDRFKKKHGL